MTRIRPSHPRGRFQWLGLLEGRIPPTPDFPGRLQRAVEAAAVAGFPVELRIDGGRFGLHALGSLREFDPEQGRPAESMEAWLQDLLRAFPDGERASLSSTLRAREQFDGQRAEILFALDPRQGLRRLERPAEEDLPEVPSRPASRRVLTGVGLLLLGLGFIAFQRDWMGIASRLEGFAYAPMEDVTAGASDWADFLELRAYGRQGTPPELFLDLAIGPVLRGGRDAWLGMPPDPTRRGEQCLSALCRGIGVVRFLDRDGQLLARAELPLEALWSGAPARVQIPWPAAAGGAQRIELGW